VLGVDIDSKHIQEASLEARRRGVTNVTFERHDATQMGSLLHFRQIDCVLAKNSIQFFEEVNQSDNEKEVIKCLL